MGNKANKWVKVRVDENTLKYWKNAALDMRYMNFSQFVRDAIDEKIERSKENSMFLTTGTSSGIHTD